MKALSCFITSSIIRRWRHQKKSGNAREETIIAKIRRRLPYKARYTYKDHLLWTWILWVVENENLFSASFLHIRCSFGDFLSLSIFQYKEAFLKANPDYRWYNPEKHAVQVASPGGKSGKPPFPLSSSESAAQASEGISPGKLAGKQWRVWNVSYWIASILIT